jgi:hypothetical protein
LQIGKNLGFSLQNHAIKVKGLDLIRRISIQWLGTKAARLTGVDGLARGQIAIWAIDRRSGGSGLAHARQRRGGRPPAANTGNAAWETKPFAPGGSSAYGEASELLQGDREVATARVKHGGATRVSGSAGT